MHDTKPEYPIAKTRWEVKFVVPSDESEHRSEVSAWNRNYACHLIEAENDGATVTSIVALD
jgi:hypothetical protein